MGSPDAQIKEWLAEYKSLTEAEVHSYANTLRHNEDLSESLYVLFHHETRHEVLDPVCHQLFEFYRSPETELRQFTLEYIPSLIFSYLQAVSRNNKKSYAGVEALLLGVYNLEIVDNDGNPKAYSFTIPSLSKASVYHEPYSLSTLSLSESVLSRHDQDQQRIFTYGPFPQVERINAQNRLTILSFLLNSYNNSIATLSSRSHQTLCKACLSIARTGFENLGTQDSNGPSSGNRLRKGVSFQEDTRITVSTDLLLEMLAGLYFVMFNSNPRLAMQAVNAIHERAAYELAADVILVTNAIRNSVHHATEGEGMKSDAMGISVSLTPSSSSSTGFNKAAITNASFRTKKLPDDIAVVSDDDETAPAINMVPTVVTSDEFDVNVTEKKPKEKDKLDFDKFKVVQKISLKSALKKPDKIKKKDSENKLKGHVSLNAPVNCDSGINDSDSNTKRLSVSVLQGQNRANIDNFELQTYVRNSESQSSLGRACDDRNGVNSDMLHQDSEECTKHVGHSHVREHNNSFQIKSNSNPVNTEV